MERKGRFKKVIVPGILFLIIISFSTFSFASVDLKNDIAALKGEIKTAQEKINKAKAGQTLEVITLHVSIKNMQKILGSLSQKAKGDQNLSAKVKNLNSSLNSLEGAKNKNDKLGAQKILNDMEGAIVAFEKEITKLPPTAIQKREPPPGKVGGSDTISHGQGIDLVVSSVEFIHCSILGWQGNSIVIRPSIKNMWKGSTSSDIKIVVYAHGGGGAFPAGCTIEGGIGPYEEKKARWCGQIELPNNARYTFGVVVNEDNAIRENNENNNRCRLSYQYTTDQWLTLCRIEGPHEPLE